MVIGEVIRMRPLLEDVVGVGGQIVVAGEKGLAADVLVLAPVLGLHREGENSTKLNVISMCAQLLLYIYKFLSMIFCTRANSMLTSSSSRDV